MNTTSVTGPRLCPPPNPDPDPPTRFQVPPGAVDTHAHAAGETFGPSAATLRRRRRRRTI